MTSELAKEIEKAIDRGDASSLEKLIADAPDDLKGTLDRTPLHYAAEKGHAKLVALLINNGAEVNAREFQEATPLHLAAANAHADVCDLLLNAGAATDLANTFASLPIHAAALGERDQKTRTKIVARMISAGSPLAHLNNSAQSPLQIAAMMGNRDLVVLLLDAMEDAGVSDPEELEFSAEEADTYTFHEVAKLIRARL